MEKHPEGVKLIQEYVRAILEGAPGGVLRIFDFDDTLVKTGARVHVTRDSEKFSLTPGEYATHEKHPRDIFDYSEFNKLIEPRTIEWTLRIFKNVYNKHGADGVTILTARGPKEPVEEFLASHGICNVRVIALGNSDPLAKSGWIASEIERDNLRSVEFFDDSPKNIAAVNALKNEFPGVKIRTRHITS